MKIVTSEFLLGKGFEKKELEIGWGRFCKNDFELVEIRVQKNEFIIGFEYQYNLQSEYKYPLTITELEQLYKILTGKDL